MNKKRKFMAMIRSFTHQMHQFKNGIPLEPQPTDFFLASSYVTPDKTVAYLQNDIRFQQLSLMDVQLVDQLHNNTLLTCPGAYWHVVCVLELDISYTYEVNIRLRYVNGRRTDQPRCYELTYCNMAIDKPGWEQLYDHLHALALDDAFRAGIDYVRHFVTPEIRPRPMIPIDLYQ